MSGGLTRSKQQDSSWWNPLSYLGGGSGAAKQQCSIGGLWGNEYLGTALGGLQGRGQAEATDTMGDLGRSLGSSGPGTLEGMGGGDRSYAGFTPFGLGWGWGDDKSSRWQGLGGGFGEWNSSTSEGGRSRQSHGYSLGLGIFDGRSDAKESREDYRGVGGNAYSFTEGGYTDEFGVEHAGAHGWGLDANYTPAGINNYSRKLDGPWGNGQLSVENATSGQYRGSLEGGVTDDGSYFGRGSFSPGSGAEEINGVSFSNEGKLGSTRASLGHYDNRDVYTGGGYYNPSTGAFGANGGYTGGGVRVDDVAFSHDFGGGVGTSGGLGSYDNKSRYSGSASWDPSRSTFQGTGQYSTGQTATDINLGVTGPDGWGANGHVGSITDRTSVQGQFTAGPDGVHANGDASFGGLRADDVGFSAGKPGVYSSQVHADSISTQSEVNGARLDITGDGVHAGVDKVRAGGIRVDGVNGRSELGSVATDYSLGHISNDVLVEGAYADVNGDGFQAGVGNVDFGGFRMNDWKSHTDFGGYGSMDTSLGSFSTSDAVKNAHLGINGDGVNFGAEEISLLGIDGSNANVNLRGPGDSHLDAHLGTLHTGLGIKGLNGGINGDGLNMSAEEVTYDAMSLQDVSLAGGVGDYYQAQASLQDGRYNAFRGENVTARVDENGVAVSGDNVSYNYLAAKGFDARTSIADGFMQQHSHLGEGSALGGRADHLALTHDGINQSLSATNLNVHGAQLSDLTYETSVGDAAFAGHADQLNALDLNVGQLDTRSSMMGLEGEGRMTDANLDLLKVQGGNLGLSYDGQTIAGASGDLGVSAGAEEAQATWDLLHGKADAQITNGRLGGQLNNGKINLFGREIDIPDMGAELRANGGARADLGNGEAAANLSLAGSSVNFAGTELTLGDWAQASAEVSDYGLSGKGNIGGENGVGADYSLTEGNLDLNLFGHEIDVDEGISDAWDATTSGVGAAVSFLTSW